MPHRPPATQRPAPQKIGRAIAWSALGTWGAQAVSTLAFLALSRLLGPQQYGVVGLIAIVLTVSQSVIFDGFAQILLRAKVLDESLVSLVFWVQLTLGLAFAGVMAAVAEPAARHYGVPELAPLTIAAGLIPVLQALGSVQFELVRRDMRFDRIALRTFGGALLGGGAGLGLALAGFGAWSLVLTQLVQAGVQAAVLWASTPWRPGRPALRGLAQRHGEDMRFGASALVGCLLNLMDTQLPRLTMALLFGVLAVGFYNFGTRLAEVVMLFTFLPLRQVAAPMFSACEGERPKLAANLAMLLRTGLVLTWPALTGLYIVAPLAAPLVFGPRWAAATPFLRTILVLFAAVPVNFIVGDLIIVAGELKLRRLVHGVSIVTGLAILAASPWLGALGAAWLYGLRTAAMAPLLLWAAARISGVMPGQLVQLAAAPAAACAVMAACTVLADRALPAGAPLVHLMIQVGVGSGAYAAALALFDRRGASQLIELVRRRGRLAPAA